jgi:histidinol-phosphate/aromatic aminotransferase/cobyric acid decarboxylase-like protein
MTVPAAGDHGGDGRMVAAFLGLDPGEVLDLSQCLNPFAPDPVPVIAAQLSSATIGRYPDRSDLEGATTALAEVLEVAPERVLVTNGGAEAIALVAGELGRGRVEEPDFSLYARHLAVLDPTGPLFRSDPNNPSGRLALPEERAEVWDEAFYPLATGVWRAPGRDDSIVVGSLTKVLACPGLRVGYVVVPQDDGARLGVPGLRTRLERRQPAWSVGPIALGAVAPLLALADVAKWADGVRDARDRLVDVLRGHGLDPLPSDANFVLVRGAMGLRSRLAREAVIIRDCASFGLPDHVRIAVPDDAGLDRLDEALTRCAGEGSS